MLSLALLEQSIYCDV